LEPGKLSHRLALGEQDPQLGVQEEDRRARQMCRQNTTKLIDALQPRISAGFVPPPVWHGSPWDIVSRAWPGDSGCPYRMRMKPRAICLHCPAMRLPTSFLALLAILALAISGCGGGDGGGSGDPLKSALAYVPANTPFAMAIDTDVEGDQFKALGELADRFPFGRQLSEQLKDQLMRGSGDVSYEDDVKPLLGNPFVVAASDPATFTDESVSDDFVAAIQASDGDKLRDVLEQSGAKEDGERAGATLYSSGDGARFAVKDDTLVVAGSDQLLDAALARAENDEGLSQEDFDAALDGLPEDGLARVYVDVQGLIQADPDTADARKVPWVDAIRTLGLTAKASGEDVAVDFNLKTEGDLSNADLPLAPGPESPGVVEQPGEINIG